MRLVAYSRAAPSHEIHLWVGAYAYESLPELSFTLDGAEAVPKSLRALSPIGDGSAVPRKNFAGIFGFFDLEPDHTYRVVVAAGAQTCTVSTRTLPDSVPRKLFGSFEVMLVSCYSQPADRSDLLGTTVSAGPLRPHLTLFLGDQVYLDLPLLERTLEAPSDVDSLLGEKYLTNWASEQLGQPGLARVLSRAPFACVPDDHEYWNNFPLFQAQLPKLWSAESRSWWKAAAEGLYLDYQAAPGGELGGHQLIEVEPLSFFLMDMRSARDEERHALMPEATFKAFKGWVTRLIERKSQRSPWYGVLVSGQALLSEPAGKYIGKATDYEMPDYAQFTDLIAQIERLAEARIPMLYLTGDVHWSRIAQLRDLKSSKIGVYEIISSPSRLLHSPFDGVVDFFHRDSPWPHHGLGKQPPVSLAGSKRLRPEKDAFVHPGDQIAMLSFARSGDGVEVQTRFYPVHPDPAVARSTDGPPIRLIAT